MKKIAGQGGGVQRWGNRPTVVLQRLLPSPNAGGTCDLFQNHNMAEVTGRQSCS